MRGCAGAGVVVVIAGLCVSATALAQQNQAGPQPPIVQQIGRPGAPIDFAGTWASVVTEDWQWRYVTPIVGDYTGVPMNSVANKLARAWSPEADAKAGDQCKGFGAAAINRLPTRMQISWVNDTTMKLDWDLGTQSRLVHFDRSAPAGAPSLQGHAVGEWIDVPAPGGRGGGGGGGGAAPPAAGRRSSGGGRRRRSADSGGGTGRPWRRAGGASRRSEDHHDQPDAAVFAAERRPGQREGRHHRVPRHRPQPGRCAVARGQDVGRRSHLPQRVVHRQLAVQEGSERVEMEPDAM